METTTVEIAVPVSRPILLLWCDDERDGCAAMLAVLLTEYGVGQSGAGVVLVRVM